MPEEFSIGEIQRSLGRLEKGLLELTSEVRTRHHALNNQIAAVTGPISSLTYRMDRVEKDVADGCGDLKRLEDEVELGKMQAARIGAAFGVVVVVGQVLMWAVSTFWRH